METSIKKYISCHPYHAQIIRSLADMDSIMDEWTHFLEQDALEKRFEQDPYIIKQQILLNPEQKKLLIILLRDTNNTIQGIAPCVIENGEFHLQFSVIRLFSFKSRNLRIFGNRFIFSRSAKIADCIPCFFTVLNKVLADFDYIYLNNFSTDNPLWNFIQANSNNDFKFSNASPKMEKVRYTILPDSYEAWLNAMSKKKRYNMKRTTRLFQDNFKKPVELIRIFAEDQVAEFLDRLDNLFSKTWQAKSMGYWKRNTSEQNSFFTEVAKKGWLRSYLLQADQEPVAFLVGYQYGDIFEYMEIGFDPEYTKLSPGSVLNNYLMEDLLSSNSPRIIDFGFGENQYKRVLGNAEHDACKAYLTTPGKWRFLVGFQLVLNKAYRTIHEFLVKAGWDKSIRNMLKKRN